MSESEPLPATPTEAHCPRCNGTRSCDLHGEVYQPWSWTDGRNSVDGGRTHRLLECRGCHQVFLWTSSWDSESYEHEWDEDAQEYRLVSVPTVETFPVPEQPEARPAWSLSLSSRDAQLGAIMGEIYAAVEAGHRILAATGLRTAFDRASSLLGISEDLTFEGKISKLQSEGFIGPTEAEILTTIVNAGNAAAHRSWTPSADDLKRLLGSLEQFIHRTIITGTSVIDVATSIPPRSSRKTKLSGSAEAEAPQIAE